jgi:hypothetical protein
MLVVSSSSRSSRRNSSNSSAVLQFKLNLCVHEALQTDGAASLAMYILDLPKLTLYSRLHFYNSPRDVYSLPLVLTPITCCRRCFRRTSVFSVSSYYSLWLSTSLS